MLRFSKAFPMLALMICLDALLPAPAVLAQNAPVYNLDSLCFLSTDVVQATIVRHPAGPKRNDLDTFTATVVDPLEGEYRSGDKIEITGIEAAHCLRPCSQAILFIARKKFQLDEQSAEVIAPQITDLLPIDSEGRVRRYRQWSSIIGTNAPETVDNAAEQKYPALAEECKIIRARWIAVGKVRPFLFHPLRQEDVPALLNLDRQRLNSRGETPGMEDVVGQAAYARLMDLRDPASRRSAQLVYRINLIAVFERVIVFH